MPAGRDGFKRAYSEKQACSETIPTKGTEGKRFQCMIVAILSNKITFSGYCIDGRNGADLYTGYGNRQTDMRGARVPRLAQN